MSTPHFVVPYRVGHRSWLVALAARQAIPAIYYLRAFSPVSLSLSLSAA
jgi:hypothetical protein